MMRTPTGRSAITLEGDTIHISGNGAYVLDGDLIIAQTGKYVISGTLQDGSIIVNAKKYSKVWLMLDGAEINCFEDACLRVDQADKVFLTLADGSENSMTSGAVYSEEALSDGTSGGILITDCYEGLEAVIIRVYDGSVTVHSRDDGLNANGSTGNFGMGGGMRWSGEDTESAETVSAEETYVLIAGGSVTVINETSQDADGIDSNGCLYITGGEIRVSLTGSGSNNAIDYGSENGGVAEISGGTIIACGSYTIAEGFDSTSAQCSILYNISDGVEAGTTVILADADGNVILTEEIPCFFSSLILSCPEMQLGQTYQLILGDSSEEITLAEVSASYGDAQSSMFGGNMNWGGMRPMGGGHRGWNQGETSEDGTAVTMPSDMDGEAPEGGTMPTPPGWDSEASEGGMMPMPSDWDGAMPMRSDRRGDESEDGSMPFSASWDSAAETATPSAGTDAQWILVGVSAAVLLLGLILAAIKKSGNLF